MNIYTDIEKVYEGDYTTIKTSIKMKKRGYKNLTLTWIMSKRRFVDSHDIRWIRKNDPDAEATLRDKVEFVSNVMVPALRKNVASEGR